MGLNDRDWYHEAIAEKNKKTIKNKEIGPIWTTNDLEKGGNKKTSFLGMILQISPYLIVIAAILLAVIAKVKT